MAHHRHHHHHHRHYGLLAGGAIAAKPHYCPPAKGVTMPARAEAAQAWDAAWQAEQNGTSDKPTGQKLHPLDFSQRTANDLRPMTFNGMVGQSRLKSLLRRIVQNARVTKKSLDHML